MKQKGKIARRGYICLKCDKVTFLEEEDNLTEFRKRGLHKYCERCLKNENKI